MMLSSTGLMNPYGLGDFTLASVVLVFAIWCIYRISRGEPQDRVVRWGVFIERQVFDKNGTPPETPTPPSESVTETHQWPSQT